MFLPPPWRIIGAPLDPAPRDGYNRRRMKRAGWLLLLAACGESAVPPPNVQFTHAPLAMPDIDHVIALGNLNPPDHSTPTDHVYLMLRNPKEPAPVFAPIGGEVAWIWRQPPHDPKVTVRVTPTLSYYFGHIFPRDEIKQGARVVAGQILGVTTGNSAALDLGVVDESVTLPFANPARYSADTLHCAAPLAMFAEPLRSALYAKVKREGPDKDGRIDQDVPGRLAGNWFREGLAPKDSAGPGGWTKSMSFARDVRDPHEVRLAVGGELALAGLFAVEGPDPADVSKASGRVTYKLTNLRDGPGGTLLVEMLDDRRLRAEANVEAFTDRALVYER